MSERTSASRSGGRTAKQTAGTTSGGTRGAARGARQFPVDGTTALKLEARSRETTETDAAPKLRVAPPAPVNAPRAPFIAGVVGVVVVGVLGILLINTKTAENSFKLDSLQKEQASLDARQQALENEIAANEMPGSLDAAARRLGLVKAESLAYIRLPDGKIVGVMTPGSGDVAVTAQEPEATPQDSGATAEEAPGQ